MVWELGRRCQQVIRDWWEFLKGVKIITVVRKDGLIIVSSIWMKLQREVCFGFRDLNKSISVKVIVCCQYVFLMNRCVKMFVLWNFVLIIELISDFICKYIILWVLRRVCELLCFFQNYFNFIRYIRFYSFFGLQLLLFGFRIIIFTCYLFGQKGQRYFRVGGGD